MKRLQCNGAGINQRGCQVAAEVEGQSLQDRLNQRVSIDASSGAIMSADVGSWSSRSVQRLVAGLV